MCLVAIGASLGQGQESQLTPLLCPLMCDPTGKNAVDAVSLNPAVLQRLESELGALQRRSSHRPAPSPHDLKSNSNPNHNPNPNPDPQPLRVLDVGAGLLSMLDPILAMANRTHWAGESVAVGVGAFAHDSYPSSS